MILLTDCLVLCTCADDSPCGSVVDHFLIWFCGAGCGLELDYPVLRETEVHALCLLHEERCLCFVSVQCECVYVCVSVCVCVCVCLCV